MVSFEVNLEIYEFIIFSLPFPKTLNGFFLCTCHTSQDIKYKKMLRILNENRINSYPLEILWKVSMIYNIYDLINQDIKEFRL